MPKRIEVKVGDRYGRLVFLVEVKQKKNRRRLLCQCDCGNIKAFFLIKLTTGQTKSCGCLAKEILLRRNITHGLSSHPLYNVWGNMKRRCFSKRTRDYKYYGGRGITICKEWLEFMPFYEWAMPHGYRKDLTIERVDNEGNYEPDNCTWIPQSKQTQNSRHCVSVVINDLKFPTVTDAYHFFGIPAGTFYHRLKRGLSIKQALGINQC